MPKKSLSDAPKHYWDACVFLAYVQEEPGCEIIEAMLEQAKRGEVVVYTSQLSIAEVARSPRCIANPAAARVSTPEELRTVDALWQPPSKIVFVDLSMALAYAARDLVRKAAALTPTRGLRSADAIHLASFVKSEAVRLVSGDERLRNAATALGMNAHPPELPPAPPPKEKSLFGETEK